MGKRLRFIFILRNKHGLKRILRNYPLNASDYSLKYREEILRNKIKANGKITAQLKRTRD